MTSLTVAPWAERIPFLTWYFVVLSGTLGMLCAMCRLWADSGVRDLVSS